MVDLYYLPESSPCRAVRMLAKAIGVRLNLKNIDILKGEHSKSEFVKGNPEQTIPTINDNGFFLWESQAIMIYLVSKYAKNDALYPENPRKKALVDQRLYFDITSLYANVLKAYLEVVFGIRDKTREEDIMALDKSYRFLNVFLQDSRFVAGDSMTIADFCIVTTVSTTEAFGFDTRRYDYVAEWYKRCEETMEKFGFEEINIAGANILKTMYKKNLES